MELDMLSYEEMKERVDSFGEHLKERICGLGFVFRGDCVYIGPQDHYLSGMNFEIKDNKTVCVLFGIMRFGNELKEFIKFDYEFWSVLDKDVLRSCVFGSYMVEDSNHLSDDGYPFYYFTEGIYEIDENDLIADEFDNQFVRFSEDVLEYSARLKEYRSMMAIMS